MRFKRILRINIENPVKNYQRSASSALSGVQIEFCQYQRYYYYDITSIRMLTLLRTKIFANIEKC